MSTLTTTLTRGDESIEVEVEYSFSKGRRGARDSLGGVHGAGPPLEPDDPPKIEIRSVKVIDLTDDENERLTELCMEDAADCWGAEEKD